MAQRHTSRFLPVTTIPFILVSIAGASIGSIFYHQHQSYFTNKAPLIALLASEFICAFVIPLSFIRSLTSLKIKVLLLAASGVATFFAGLFFVRSIIHQDVNIIELYGYTLFKVFFGLFFATLFVLGIAFGQHLQEWVTHGYEYQTQNHYEDGTEINDKNSLKQDQPPKKAFDKLISFKTSAATLVDHSTKRPGHSNTDQSTSNSTRNSSVYTYHQQKESNNRRVSPMDRLPVIHQTSSTSLATHIIADNLASIENKHLSANLITPMLARARNSSIDKNLLVERDALKRIPSALLPPHLKVHDKATPLLDSSPIFDGENPTITHSVSELFLQPKVLEENVTQSIPRAMTVHQMFPYSIGNTEGNGIRTISLDDWKKHNEEIHYQETRNRTGSFSQFQATLLPQRFSEDSGFSQSTERVSFVQDTGSFIDKEEDEIEASNEHVNVNNSAEEAMKYIEDAHEGLCNNEVFETAINQSQSNIPLEETASSSPIKTRSHSPHKSLFKHQSQKSSLTSFTFKNNNSYSVPSSPTKKALKSSPRKLKIKNLSLSSIVYKYPEEEQPDFSYVRELQRTQSRRKSPVETPATPVKNQAFEKILAERTNTTPDSNWSENSHKSVFPSDVIGEYDKEKWKTMERLNLVGAPAAE